MSSTVTRSAGLQECQINQKKDLTAVWMLHGCAAGLQTKHLCKKCHLWESDKKPESDSDTRYDDREGVRSGIDRKTQLRRPFLSHGRDLNPTLIDTPR